MNKPFVTFGEIITISIESCGTVISKTTDFSSQAKEKRLEVKKKCRRSPRTDFMIKGKTFSQYLEKRLLVDNLGFKPTNEILEGSTDGWSYIAAAVPKNAVEFLVYAHELGHCKSKQYERDYYHGLYASVCENTVENELNAWV